MPAWRRKGNCHILEVEPALPLKATPRIPLGVMAGGAMAGEVRPGENRAAQKGCWGGKGDDKRGTRKKK